MLMRVISGGQTGVDQAALRAAYDLGLSVGGTMPKGFRTRTGPMNPALVRRCGMTEHHSSHYAPRTFENVRNADATLVLAVDMNSPGTRLTHHAIQQLRKPHMDVTLLIRNRHPGLVTPTEVADWIKTANIEILNVAGNSETTARGIDEAAHRYLIVLFRLVLQRQSAVQSTSQIQGTP